MDRFEALFLQNLIRGRVDRRFIDVYVYVFIEDVELVGVEDKLRWRDVIGWDVPVGTAGSLGTCMWFGVIN